MSDERVPWNRLTLEIDSRLEAVVVSCQVVYLLCIAAGFAPVKGSEVEVCVAEALNNSIKHAYQGDPAGKVELEVVLLRDELIIDVWDSGAPGDPADIHTDHLHSLEIQSDRIQDISECGRGLAVIQEVMDAFGYTPGKERNRLRMIKRRERPPRPTSAPLN
jgi:anti-sigma regulatory factor (Ser/Thr protein kinase)